MKLIKIGVISVFLEIFEYIDFVTRNTLLFVHRNKAHTTKIHDFS